MCLHVYDWLLVVVVESNPSVHFCVQERDLFKWRMIIAVVRNFVQLRKESLKKIQACTTGFEPLTSAIPVQRSVNLAVAVISAMNFIEEWQLFAFSTKLSLLFTCLDLCSIGSLPSVPETFHAPLPVSVKSQFSMETQANSVFYSGHENVPGGRASLFVQCSLWYVVPAYRRQRSSANKVQPNMFWNTLFFVLYYLILSGNF